MQTPSSTSHSAPSRQKRPFWATVLAGYSLVLAIITGIPQLYYVLFAAGLVTIGPHSNPLGQIWYSYILVGDNSYRHVDPGILAGALEDAFLLGPLYCATGIGLLRRSRWVYPVGLITAAMIFYAIVGFFLGDLFGGLTTVTNQVSYWASNLPYLLYPIWLGAALLTRRHVLLREAAPRSIPAHQPV